MPSPPELASDLAGVVQRIRGLYADALEMIGELDRTGAVQSLGYASLTALLGDLLRVAPAQARRMIRHAEQVTDTLTPTGHHTPAPLPLAGEALRAGDLDAEHLDAITDTVRKIPTWAPAGTTGIVETALVHAAGTAHPGLVRKHGEVLLTRIDQDGPTPDTDHEHTRPNNTFRYRRTQAGRMHFSGDIDPEAAEELDSLLGTLGTPDGPDDQRSVPHRLGDAFATVVHRAVDDPDLPIRGGEKPHLNIFLDLPTLTEGVGHATLEAGGTLSAAAARRLACDANLIPIVLNGHSIPLDLGRTHRLVPPRLRTALVARDRGCAFPGCDRPARWADAHHLRHWADGGPTDLDNLVLLCRRHHRLVHHSDWHVRMAGGTPEFIPPAWLDHHRTPRRNTVHRLTA